MTIKNIANVYLDFFKMTIRIFEGGEMTFCENAWELPSKMTKGEYDKLMNTEFKAFESNGVALQFYK